MNIIKMKYELPGINVQSSATSTLSIQWDKVSDREGKANILQVLNVGGSNEEIFVGGYTSRIDASVTRDYKVTLL